MEHNQCSLLYFSPGTIPSLPLDVFGRAKFGCGGSAMPHRNALNLDAAHNTAIRAEIGERLRVLLSKEAETVTLRACCAGGGPTLSHNSLNLGLFLVPRLHGGFLVRADWSGPRAFGLLFQAHFPTPKPIDGIRPPILGNGRIGTLA